MATIPKPFAEIKKSAPRADSKRRVLSQWRGIDLTPLGRISRPEDIAAFAYMLVRDEFFETGQIWNYSGGKSLLGHPRFLA